MQKVPEKIVQQAVNSAARDAKKKLAKATGTASLGAAVRKVGARVVGSSLGIAGLLAGTALLAGKLASDQTQRGVDKMISDTEGRLKRKLTAQEKAALTPQYRNFVKTSFAAAAKKASGRG